MKLEELFLLVCHFFKLIWVINKPKNYNNEEKLKEKNVFDLFPVILRKNLIIKITNVYHNHFFHLNCGVKFLEVTEYIHPQNKIHQIH